jgi:hypothetical protein
MKAHGGETAGTFVFLGNDVSRSLFCKNAMTTIEELQAIVAQSALDTQAFKAQLAASQEAADRRAAEADRLFAESKAEADKRTAETDRQIKELGKQIGGIGNKFGYFAEGMFLPSIERILYGFGMTTIAPRLRVRKEGKEMEIDVLGYTNGSADTAFIVEVKSNFRREHIAEMLDLLAKFPVFSPEHREKALFGMLAVIDTPADLCEEALREGLYVARVGDDVAELLTPAGFTPKNFRVA